MSVRVLTTEAEFEALQESWDELFHSNPNHSPYQSWRWNYTWWQHFGKPGRLRLLVAEENGRLIGIAPFCVRSRFRGWPLKHLSFIARKRAEYLDFIVRSGCEAAFFRELCEFLRAEPRGWRFIELRDFSEQSSNLPFLLREIGRTFPALSLESTEICVTLPLPSTWDAFVATLGKRVRKDVGYDRRYLAKSFQVELKIIADASAGGAAHADLLDLYRGRWRAEKGATQFDQADSAAFEHEIVTAFSALGWYRLYMLYVDGQAAAGLLGYVCANKFFGEVFVHAPQFHKYSVGNVLLGMAVEDCIAKGWSELDLARGDEPYKHRWNGRIKRNYHLKIFPSRAALLLAALAEWIYELGPRVTFLHRLRARYRGWRHGPASPPAAARTTPEARSTPRRSGHAAAPEPSHAASLEPAPAECTLNPASADPVE